ncbi:hypothetical protein [Indioceanicola profundi]|uniref:hypothetical protein n=1 Tax=Indioceanicola profundi TaxID=2220096 RepID=UPI000E6AA426|nr:hypothetical protein [Indioceanicola profundi]
MPNLLARDNPMTIVMGPIVWGAHFVLVYVFNAIACAKGAGGTRWLGLPMVAVVVSLLTVLALALIGWLAWIAWKRYQPVRDAAHLVQEKDIDRSVPARQRFLAYAALLLCGLSALSTFMVGMPALWVPACG